jgi:hypothetical protein
LNDPSKLLNPILAQFSARIAESIERFTVGRVEAAIAKQVRSLNGRGARRQRAVAHCYYPGCRNIAAPRFGMFCAALHKGLPKAEKDKYRTQHLGERAKNEKRATPRRAAKRTKRKK